MDAKYVDQGRKMALLNEPLLGQWVAEWEADQLRDYFFETRQFRELFGPNAKDKGVIYGPKGSGKSAIYCLLRYPTEQVAQRLRENHVLVVEAEATRADSVFRDAASELKRAMKDVSDVTQDREQLPEQLDNLFEYLWKLYFLVILGETFQSLDLKDGNARQVIDALKAARLLPEYRPNDHRNFLVNAVRVVKDYVVSYLKRVKAINVTLPPTLHTPPLGGEIVFYEPSREEELHGYRWIDTLLTAANHALRASGNTVWLTIDHLDLAFSSDARLESYAVGALLLNVFGYFRKPEFEHIKLKIFLRSDIWARLIDERKYKVERLVDAQKIARIDLNAQWTNSADLVMVVMRRLAKNSKLCSLYKIESETLRSDREAQRKFFYRIMPPSVSHGQNSIDWAYLMTKDGSGQTSPRDLLHLLTEAQDIQWSSERIPTGDMLLDAQALREAWKRVSLHDYQQALLAENPKLVPYISAIATAHQGLEFTLDQLHDMWRKNVKSMEAMMLSTAEEKADQLKAIGFFIQDQARPVFEKLKLEITPDAFVVAPLYRQAIQVR